ncbi:hypothetical protein B5X24_HaOG200873 [Helicoverpa armigera]|uniref:Gustatory receptor n=1 Tax=Helicoverpa armigera TaxID=29058 RepID=A0A2W1BC42_HELAM|nr:hypothetical protein B5X24_HaOG200873 [Helicoverpa armigera]
MDVQATPASIKTIMFIRLLCGFYCDISANKIVTVLVRVYCVAIITLVMAFGIYLWNGIIGISSKIHFLFITTPYITSMVTNICFHGEYFSEFLNKMENFNLTHGFLSSIKIPISSLFFVFVFLQRFLFQMKFTFDAIGLPFRGVLTHASFILILCLMNYTAEFSIHIMFELLWHRMGMLRKRLEQDISTARILRDGEESIRENIRTCMRRYQHLLETARVTDGPVKFLVDTYIFITAR